MVKVLITALAILLYVGRASHDAYHVNQEHIHHVHHGHEGHHHMATTSEYHFPMSGSGDGKYSFKSPFPWSPDAIVPNWIATGATVKASMPSGGELVRLTPMMRSTSGNFYHQMPVKTSDGFDMYFDFSVKKGDDSPEPADGLAFWFTEKPPALGPVHGNEASFKGLGIIVDTYSNNRRKRHPYVYGWVNDGHPNWVDNRDGDGVELTKGCTLDLQENVRVFVQYRHKTVKVAISIKEPHNHHYTCFSKSDVDLGFPTAYFGFSASTGHFFASHDLSSVQIRATANVFNALSDHARAAFQDRVIGDEIGHPNDHLNAFHDRDPMVAGGEQGHIGDHPSGGSQHGSEGHEHLHDFSKVDVNPGSSASSTSIRAQTGASVDFNDLSRRLDQSMLVFSTEILANLAKRDLSGGGPSEASGMMKQISQGTMTLVDSVAKAYQKGKETIAVGSDLQSAAQSVENIEHELSREAEDLEHEVESVTDLHHELTDVLEELKEEVQFMRESIRPGGKRAGNILFGVFIVVSQVTAFLLIVFIRKTSGGKKAIGRIV